MPMYDEPVVGAIYEDLEEDGRTFEVVAFDENDGTIEVQYADGTTEEIDLDDWYGMDLEKLESEDEDETEDEPEPDDETDLEEDLDVEEDDE